MGTTTIRVDTETHALLQELATQRGENLMRTAHSAAEALWKVEFAKRVMAQYEALRADPEAWADYLADAESTHVVDGID